MLTKSRFAALAACLSLTSAQDSGANNCLAPTQDSNGQWDKRPNAAVSQGGQLTQYSLDTTMHLKCNPGYTPTPADGFGQASMTCGNGGGMYPLWAFPGDYPTCKSASGGADDNDGITCLTPPLDDHGSWSTMQSYAINSRTILQCQQGYQASTDDGETVVQASLMTCGQGGMWEFEGEFAQCVSLTACNGQKCGAHDINGGGGDAVSNCLTPGSDPHGKWTGAGGVANAIMGHVCSNCNYNPGDFTLLNCDDGYTPSAEDGESLEAASMMTCGSGGLWEFQGSFAICVGTSAANAATPPPPSLDNTPSSTPSSTRHTQTYHDQDDGGGISWYWWVLIVILLLVAGDVFDKQNGGPGVADRVQGLTGGKKIGAVDKSNIYASAEVL